MLRSRATSSLLAWPLAGSQPLAFALTTGLAMTVRRQAVERDRLQAELRAASRLAALGKLLAGVAHEVRNPLAGIRSTAQLWCSGVVGLDDESLGGLVHEVDRLEEIVSRLLQFSRADAQQLAPGDLNSVLAEAARLAAGPAESNACGIEVELDPESPVCCNGLRALLQVFPQPDQQRRPGHDRWRRPLPLDPLRPGITLQSWRLWPTPARG